MSPAYVTLFVYRVTASQVSAHECLGECCLYVGEVTVPRPSMPRVRAGDRVRLNVIYPRIRRRSARGGRIVFHRLGRIN